MASKRIKAFNTLLRELKTSMNTAVPFKLVKNRLDLQDFQNLFTKQQVLESELPSTISIDISGVEETFWNYIPKMYACTIADTAERESFLKESASEPGGEFGNLIQELAPLINPQEIQGLFDPSELADPMKMISKLMDPNNEKMKVLGERLKPVLEQKITSGQIDPEKITQGFQDFFKTQMK